MKKIVSIWLIVAMLVTSCHFWGPAEVTAAPESESPKETAGFGNVSVDLVNRKADVTWYGDAQQIRVGFYEDDVEKDFEDLELLYEKVQAVTPSQESSVSTTIALDENVPQYFMLKVSLEDQSGQSVANPYISNAYTTTIREVSEKTVDDYQDVGDRLVELAENSGADEGSFLVLADDVIRLEEGTGQAGAAENAKGLQIDLMPANDGMLYCNLSYVGTDTTDQLKQIQKGSRVFIIDEMVEGDETKTGYYMFTADSATVDEKENSAVLKGTVDEGVDENGMADTQTIGSFLKATNIKTTSTEYHVQKEFPIHMYGTLDLDLRGKVTVSLVTNSSLKETTANITVINEINCPDTEVDLELPTVTYDIPIIKVPIVVTGIFNFDFDVNFRISGTVTGGIRFDYQMTTGIEIMVTVGWFTGNVHVNNKSSGPSTTFRGFSLQGSVFLGPTVGFSVDVLKIMSLSADLETGLEITGKLTSGHYYNEEKRYHACKDFQCVDGDVEYKMLGYSISLNAAVFSRGLSGSFGPTFEITPFYYSGTYDDSAATHCPHYGYRLYVHVQDQTGNPVVGAEVSYDADQDENEQDPQFSSVRSDETNSEGTATIYLPEGIHKITVSAKDDTGHTYVVTQDFDETGYDAENDCLRKPDLSIILDTSRHKISFVDLNQEGEASNMPDPIYTYPDQATAKIPDQRPQKDNMIFLGWSKDQNSSTVDYEPGEDVTATEDEQLYAVWAYATYTILFHSNKPGNASEDVTGTVDAMSPTYQEKFPLAKNTYALRGWEFTGWNTKPDGSGNSYSDQALIEEPMEKGQKKTVTLYAQWEPKKYTVTFQDGEENFYYQEMTFDQAEQLTGYEQCGFKKEGSIFTHWSTFAVGSSYSDKETVVNLCTFDANGNPTGNVLTANWIENNSTTIIIRNDGKMVNTDNPDEDIVLKNLENKTEFQGMFQRVESGIYRISSNSPTNVPEGTYEVILQGGLAGYDTQGRTIEVSPDPGAYQFDFYTVQISADEHARSWIGSEGTTEKERVLVGTQLEIGTEVDEGYSFESYTAIGSTPGFEKDVTEPNQTITVTGKVLITGHPAANRYTVMLCPNFEGGGEPVSQDMIYDEPQNLFANPFVRYGYEFAGWTTTPTWAGPIDYGEGARVSNLTAKKDAEVLLYAQWQPVRTWICFHANGGTGEMPDEETFYETLTSLSPCEFSREHWLFDGWNTKEDGTGISYPDQSTFVSYNGEKDDKLDLYAQWRLEDYTIDYDLAGGTLTKPNPATYTYETEDFTLQNPVREGYIFLGWTGSNGNEPEKEVTIGKGSSGNQTYQANWKPEIKTITFDPAGGSWSDGETDPISMEAEYDSEITLPDMPVREYYTFQWWQSSNERNYNPGHIYKVTEDQTFKADWDPILYMIAYDLAGGRVEGTNPGTYTAETEDFTLINPVREGYIFLGWTGSNGDKPETEVTIKKGSGGNLSYTANWKAQKSDKNNPSGNQTDGGSGAATGDHAQPLLWMLLMLGAAVLIVRRIRK